MTEQKIPEELVVRKGEPYPERERLIELSRPFPEFGLPHVPIFLDDFIADTLDLSAEEVGAYMLILLALWRRDCEPIPEAKLHRVARVSPARWKKHIWPELRRYFRVGPHGVWNNRLEEEWRESATFSLKKRYAGSSGGSAKALKCIDGGLSTASSNAPSPPPSTKEIPDGISLGTVQQKKRRSPERPLPRDWVPDMDKARALMQEHDLTRTELNYCYQRMKAHAEQTERRLRDWDAGFRSWIIKAIHDGEIGPEAKSRNSKGGSGTAFDF